MNSKLGVSGIALAVALISSVVNAATVSDGDACSEAGATWQQKDSQGSYHLICDGSNWKTTYTIDAAQQVGIGNTEPKTSLDVSGEIKLGNTSATCDGDTEGALRWNTTDDNVEVCDGTEWKDIISTSAASSSDPTPDAFSFTDVTNQTLSALILSNELTITGFDGPVIAEVSGAGTPQISINDGAWVTAGEINPGETLRVRLISSGSVSTARVAAVTVGDTTDNWSVTTKAGQTRMFATSGQFTGAGVGGLAGGDAICASEASTNGYAGTWKALLSDSTTDAKDRLTIVYPVVRPSGTVIDASNIWDGNIAADVSGGVSVWTGTGPSGTKHASNYCSDWSSTSGSGRTGYSNFTHSGWISHSTDSCSSVRGLYCVEQ